MWRIMILVGAGLLLISGCSTLSSDKEPESAEDLTPQVEWQLNSEDKYDKITVILEPKEEKKKEE